MTTPEGSYPEFDTLVRDALPEFKTDKENVVIRMFGPQDAPALFEAISEDRNHLTQHREDTGSKPQYQTLESTLASITNPDNPNRLRYGIWAGDRLVGSINLQRIERTSGMTMGYWVRKSATGNGYASAAAKATAQYALTTLGRDFVLAATHPDNVASQKVLLGAGFRETPSNDDDKQFMIEKEV